MCGCRGDKAVEYSRKLEYLKREEELIKEEELEAEALLQPSAQTLQVPLQPVGPALAGCCATLSMLVLHTNWHIHTHTPNVCVCACVCNLGLLSASLRVLHMMQCVTNTCKCHARDTHSQI